MKNALGAVQAALVLGGGSEIAQATMRKLVAHGCKTVVLGVRDPSAVGEQIRELTNGGATSVRAITFDATDTRSHQSAIEQCFVEHSDIDLVLIAFGVLGHGAGIDTEPQAAAEAVTTNYVGAVSAGLAAAHCLRNQGHGTIVVLSSVAGERARRSNFVYGSSKSGLDSFAQGLGDSLVGSGVRVVVVRPGFVHSKMTKGLDPAPFATTPEVVADAIAEALASGKEIVWVPSVLRWVAMAFHLLPRPLWRRVSANR
ncbi:MAG: decaprenylphospho-beta-D-erythro-pentofuranosid-2-ulose 2-reductase [Acidimicrobiaceae bacterium]|jgi:decaprenylphospho-beta-D-erythro-pentofuranosid-2-ulose 2-reductase